jgi:hypothetical protein
MNWSDWIREGLDLWPGMTLAEVPLLMGEATQRLPFGTIAPASETETIPA